MVSYADARGRSGEDIVYEWDNLLPGSFQIDGFQEVSFPVWDRMEAEQALREVPREIPWVEGELVDDTGTTAEVWQTSMPMFNDVQENEGGYGTSPVFYPTRLELLWTIFRKRQTGTLHLPFRRNIRAKAIRWRRWAIDGRRNGEVLDVTWKENNEANLDGPSSDGMPVQANLQRTITEAVFEAERGGMWGGDWEDITRLGSQLEAALNAPDEFRDDIRQKAGRLAAACESLMKTFQSKTPGRDKMRDPEGDRAHARLFRLMNLAARAESESRESGEQVITLRFAHGLTLIAIAARVGQTVDTLMRLNPEVGDPNWIPRGTPIRVLRK